MTSEPDSRDEVFEKLNRYRELNHREPGIALRTPAPSRARPSPKMVAVLSHFSKDCEKSVTNPPQYSLGDILQKALDAKAKEEKVMSMFQNSRKFYEILNTKYLTLEFIGHVAEQGNPVSIYRDLCEYQGIVDPAPFSLINFAKVWGEFEGESKDHQREFAFVIMNSYDEAALLEAFEKTNSEEEEQNCGGSDDCCPLDRYGWDLPQGLRTWKLVDGFIKNDAMINAIKEIRSNTKMDLKEAKYLADARRYRIQGGIKPPCLFDSKEANDFYVNYRA